MHVFGRWGRLGIEPGTLLLWGDSANHMQPSCPVVFFNKNRWAILHLYVLPFLLSVCFSLTQMSVSSCSPLHLPFSHIISLFVYLLVPSLELSKDLGLLSSSSHLHPFILFPPLMLLITPLSLLFFSPSLPSPCLTCILSPKNKPKHTSKHTHILTALHTAHRIKPKPIWSPQHSI